MDSDAVRTVVGEWIRKGDHDLGMGRLGVESGSVYTDGIAFHCQQAAEKYVKALLVAKGLRFGRVHDLAALLDLLADDIDVPDEYYDDAEILNAYAVEVRYPAGIPDPSADEAREALTIAERWRATFLRHIEQHRPGS